MSRTAYLVSWIYRGSQSAGYSIHTTTDGLAEFVEKFTILKPDHRVVPDGVEGDVLADRIFVNEKSFLNSVLIYSREAHLRLVPNSFPPRELVIPQEILLVDDSQGKYFWLGDVVCQEAGAARLASVVPPVRIPLGPSGAGVRDGVLRSNGSGKPEIPFVG